MSDYFNRDLAQILSEMNIDEVSLKDLLWKKKKQEKKQEKKEFPPAAEYIDPNKMHWSHSEGRTFVYVNSTGSLLLDKAIKPHQNILRNNPDLFIDIANKSGITYKDEPITEKNFDTAEMYVMGKVRRQGEAYALFGRSGYIGDGERADVGGYYISFWNDNSESYGKLKECLAALENEGIFDAPREIGEDIYVSAPIFSKKIVTIEKSSDSEEREPTPEEAEEIRLRRELHIATGAEKEAIKRKLGMGKGNEPKKFRKRHPANTGLVPGVKSYYDSRTGRWIELTSESIERKIDKALF